MDLCETEEWLKGCLCQTASAALFGLWKDKNMNQILVQVFRWSLHSSDIYEKAQNPFHSSVQCWWNIHGSLERPKHGYDGYDTISLSLPPPRPLIPPPPSVFSLTLAAVARLWRTAQSPCPSDTRMGSSQTATAATGSKWQSRNTWRPSLGKGIDRELETKDVGSHICSTVPKPEKTEQKNKKKQRNKKT